MGIFIYGKNAYSLFCVLWLVDKICVATIGVCVFHASTSVGAFFNSRRFIMYFTNREQYLKKTAENSGLTQRPRKKAIIAIVVLLLCVTIIPLVLSCNQPKSKKDFSNDLKIIKAGYKLLTEGGEYGDINFARYYLYDMNNDGKKEIIILAGTCEADALLLINAYENESYTQIGYTGGNHASICGSKSGNGIIVHYRHQGIESITSVTIDKNGIAENELVPSYWAEGEYTELDDCVPLDSYAINDLTPFKSILESETGNGTSAPTNVVDISLGLINTSASDFLQERWYMGDYYISNWGSNKFISGDPTIYNLKLTGSEVNYYFSDSYTVVTVRDDRIVGISQAGFQVSYIKNTYQLLKWLGGDISTLVNHEPEIIRMNDPHKVYLKWETNNGYLVIFTTWYQGLTDWRNSLAWDFCIFTK